MWILLTYKNCSNESENAPDCIDFGLFFKKIPGGGGACPRTPLDCASAMQMRMSRRLCRRSIDSSTRKNFPLFSQQSVTGYEPFTDKGGGKQVFPKKTPDDELQKMPHTEARKFKPEPRLEPTLQHWWRSLARKADELTLAPCRQKAVKQWVSSYSEQKLSPTLELKMNIQILFWILGNRSLVLKDRDNSTQCYHFQLRQIHGSSTK